MNLFKVALVGLWVMRNLMFLYVISTGAGLFIRAIADKEKLTEVYKNGTNLLQPPINEQLAENQGEKVGKIEIANRKGKKRTMKKIYK